MTPTTVIVLTLNDGSVGRMQFFASPTDQNIQAAIAKTGLAVTSWRRCQLSDFPRGSVKRNWRDRGGRIVEDNTVSPLKN